jgi:hypothetical protein
MTLRSFTVCAAILMLAGCAEPAAPAAAGSSTTTNVNDPGTFSETTGAIQGLVTDDSLAPLEGAEVALADLGKTASTDAGGRFAFSQLEPGAYVLAAAKAGYKSAVRRVEVKPGEQAEASFQLIPLPSDEPYSLTQKQAGMICFGANVGQTLVPEQSLLNQSLTGPLATTPCEMLKSVLGSSSTLTWNLQLNGSTQFLVETAWQPGQGLASGLITYLQFMYPAASGGTPHKWKTHERRGPSPLNITVLTDVFGLAPDGTPNCRAKCLDSRHFPYANSGAGPLLVNVLVQQRFDEYLTTFYGTPPAHFTALADK